jgi:hypothetical protein
MSRRDTSSVRPFIAAGQQAAAPASAKRDHAVRLTIALPSGPLPLNIDLAGVRELGAFLSQHNGSGYGVLTGRLAPDGITLQSSIHRALDFTAGDNSGNAQKRISSLETMADLVLAPLSPIGLFRAQSGGPATLTEEDCSIIQRCSSWLPKGAALFLVIRAVPQLPRSAAVFLAGEKPGKSPLLEFPFDDYLLQNGYLAPFPPAPVALTPAPVPGKPSAARWATMFLLAAAAGVGLSAVAGLVIRQWNSSPANQGNKAPLVQSLSPSVDIEFRAARTGQDVDLSWNRSSAPILSSTGGSLSIRDGSVSRDVPLSAVQLREGHILYQAQTGSDLEFRLEVSSPTNDKIAQSVEILGLATSNSAVATAKPNPAARSHRPAGSASVPTPSQSSPPPTPQPSASAQPVIVPPPVVSNPSQLSTQVPANPAGWSHDGVAITPVLPSPSAPVQTPAVQTTPPKNSPAQSQPPVVALQQSPAQTLVTPSDVKPSTPPVPNAAQPGPALTVASYVGPQPIKKANPMLSHEAVEELRGTRGPVTVAVRMRIDGNGSVRAAETVSVTGNPKAGGVYLRMAATSAARNWRFQAATIGGKPVPSEMTITFAFQN